MDRTKRSWINAILLAITLVINTLGGMGIINDTSQSDVSDRFPTLITPSSMTFSIWSVIYGLLIISIIVMIIKKDDPYYGHAIDEISPLFWISSLINAAWIITFSYVLVELALVLIFALVVVLTLICRKLLAIQDRKRWLLPITFGLYAGWLFIATVVNTAATLVKVEWNGFGLADETWALIILIVALVLVILVMLNLRNAAFPLPVAWAYLGIYMKLQSPDGYDGQYGTLQIIALVGMAILIGAAAIQLYRNSVSILPVAGRDEQYRR